MSSRGSIFTLQMAYLAGLGAVALLYFKGIWIHADALGTVPIAVLWWGALGAVLLSLSGIFDHCEDWDPCFKYWHWARPVVGAAMGAFGVLAFQGGILAAGNSLKSPTGVANASSLFYYTVAFVLGYREETTRALIKRVADVIIAPGDTPRGGNATTGGPSPVGGPTDGEGTDGAGVPEPEKTEITDVTERETDPPQRPGDIGRPWREPGSA